MFVRVGCEMHVDDVRVLVRDFPLDARIMQHDERRLVVQMPLETALPLLDALLARRRAALKRLVATLVVEHATTLVHNVLVNGRCALKALRTEGLDLLAFFGSTTSVPSLDAALVVVRPAPRAAFTVAARHELERACARAPRAKLLIEMLVGLGASMPHIVEHEASDIEFGWEERRLYVQVDAASSIVSILASPDAHEAGECWDVEQPDDLERVAAEVLALYNGGDTRATAAAASAATATTIDGRPLEPGTCGADEQRSSMPAGE